MIVAGSASLNALLNVVVVMSSFATVFTTGVISIAFSAVNSTAVNVVLSAGFANVATMLYLPTFADASTTANVIPSSKCSSIVAATLFSFSWNDLSVYVFHTSSPLYTVIVYVFVVELYAFSTLVGALLLYTLETLSVVVNVSVSLSAFSIVNIAGFSVASTGL